VISGLRDGSLIDLDDAAGSGKHADVLMERSGRGTGPYRTTAATALAMLLIFSLAFSSRHILAKEQELSTELLFRPQ
jgi:hypothetical protein